MQRCHLSREARIYASIAVYVVAGVVGLAAVQSGASSVQRKTLFATVSTGAIVLKTSEGNPVSVLRAGTYVFVVSDRSSRQNFHLIGPPGAVNKMTGVRFVGDTRWTLRLGSARYSYVSDPSRTKLRGNFRIV
jgi:hypothetical protein